MDLSKTNLLSALYCGFYGLTLFCLPEMFYGPKGLMPYFKHEAGFTGMFYGRAFGAMNLALASGYYFESGSVLVTKMFTTALVLMIPLFSMAAVDPDNYVKFMWCLQFIPHCLLIGMNFHAISAKESKKS